MNGRAQQRKRRDRDFGDRTAIDSDAVLAVRPQAVGKTAEQILALGAIGRAELRTAKVVGAR